MIWLLTVVASLRQKLGFIDNHSSGYLGMAVEHCVRAYLGPHCILAQKQHCQKPMAQLNSTAFFTPGCAI